MDGFLSGLAANAPLIAVVAAVVVAIAAALVLQVFKSAAHQTAAGITYLCTLKWNDLAGVLTQVLRRRGFEPADNAQTPGNGDVDVMLARGKARYLAQCKPGRNFKVQATQVRRLLDLVELQGATGGLLVTTGRVLPDAAKAARGKPVDLIDGPEFWDQAQDFLGDEALTWVNRVAARRRQGRWAMVAIAAFGIAFLVLGSARLLERRLAERAAMPPPAASAAAAATPEPPAAVPAEHTAVRATPQEPVPPVSTPTPTPAPATPAPIAPAETAAEQSAAPQDSAVAEARSDAPAAAPTLAPLIEVPSATPTPEPSTASSAPVPAPASPPAAVPAPVAAVPPAATPSPAAAPAAAPPAAAAPAPPINSTALGPRREQVFTEEQENARRVEVAGNIGLVDGVVSAEWSTRSTILIALKAGDDATRAGILARICVELVKFDELRYSRLQLHDFAAKTEQQAGVRWHQCR